jgi:hypothetical protein
MGRLLGVSTEPTHWPCVQVQTTRAEKLFCRRALSVVGTGRADESSFTLNGVVFPTLTVPVTCCVVGNDGKLLTLTVPDTAWAAGKLLTLTVPDTAWVAGKLSTLTILTLGEAFPTVTGSELFPTVTVPETPTESAVELSGLVTAGLVDVFTTVVWLVLLSSLVVAC